MTTHDATVTRLPWDAGDPFAYYERKRESGDVVWDDAVGAWLVLGYDSARQVLAASGFTSDPAANPNTSAAFRAMDRDLVRRNMLFADGSDHARLRGAVRDVFTPSFIAGLGDGVGGIASETIDAVEPGVEFDFMAEIAMPLPIAVAAAWLDLDVDSARLLREESPAISRMLGQFNDADSVEAGTAAVATLMTDLLPLAAERRNRPGDDLLSYLAADAQLGLDEVVITAVVIAVAGHETTANLLGAAMVRLLTTDACGHRPMDDLDPVDHRVVRELLRLDGPVQAVGRRATREQTVGGVTIGAGEPVLVVIAAANRDPTMFSRPERFRLDGSGPAPITFGYGAHHCLGAALARLELAVALRHVLARRPSLRGIPSWRDTPAIRGPQQVPCVFV